MAFSLEARVPYLDHAFYAWCARLDPAQKVRGDARKLLLKQLAERYLPHDIVHRPKQGFMMPLDRWLARELQGDIAEALGPRGLQRRGLLRPQAIARLVAEHNSGRKNHAMRLWVLLILERWFARYEPDFTLLPS
jgi:asparagine synthase (glutamine-hydrolysing)